jgi:hypothetical protein
MESLDLKQAISQLQPTAKSARLRELMPAIEDRLAAGVQLKVIHETLKKGGLTITLGTLKNYLYRHRKQTINAIPPAVQAEAETRRMPEEGKNSQESAANGSARLTPSETKGIALMDQATLEDKYDHYAKRKK